MIGGMEGNWKQMLADLDNLTRDHLSLGSEVAFTAKYQSLRSEDRHFVAAYERFAERLVNTLDEVTRNLLILKGGDRNEVENLTGPGALRMSGSSAASLVRMSGLSRRPASGLTFSTTTGMSERPSSIAWSTISAGC